MIKTMDILKEVSRTLRLVFPGMHRVFLERIKKQDRPAISLEVVHYSAPAQDPYVVRKMVDVDIVFFPRDGTVAECIAVEDELTRAFSLGLKVGDRFIHMGEAPDVKIVDQILHFVVQFDYFDELKPLIGTKHGHLAEPDPGAGDIDNLIDEKEVEPDPHPVPPKEDGEKIIKRRDETVVESLKMMEVLKMNYKLKG